MLGCERMLPRRDRCSGLVTGEAAMSRAAAASCVGAAGAGPGGCSCGNPPACMQVSVIGWYHIPSVRCSIAQHSWQGV